jgi:hypothetical protein
MLDFDQRPPVTVDDVNLSPAGEYALFNSNIDSSEAMRAFGRAALTEIIDAFGDKATFSNIHEYLPHVAKQASEVIYSRYDDSSRFRWASRSDAIGFRFGIGIHESGYPDRKYVEPFMIAAVKKGEAGIAK